MVWNFDVTANLSKNLSTYLTVSQNETVVGNVAPEQSAYLDEYLPIWDAAVVGSAYEAQYATDRAEVLREFDSRVTNFEGNTPEAQSEYKAAMRMNYTITEGSLSGFNFGIGGRYNSGRVIGAAADGSLYRSPSETYVDANFGYRTSILDGKAQLRFTVNVINLLDKDGILITSATAGGVPDAYRFINPRMIRFTSSVSF